MDLKDKCKHEFETDGGKCIHCGKFEWQLLDEEQYNSHIKLNEEELTAFRIKNITKKYSCLHKFSELFDDINLGIVSQCDKCGYIEKRDFKIYSVAHEIPKELLEQTEMSIKEDHGTKELKKLLKSITEMSIEEYNELYERALKDLKETEMKDLKDYTLEELESEVLRRKKPMIRNLHCSYTSDMNHLANACKDYIDEVGKIDDFSNYRNEIFEKAMELCYGQDVWQYTNSFYKD